MSTEVPSLQSFCLDIFNFTMAPGFDDPVRLLSQASDMSLVESLSAVGRDEHQDTRGHHLTQMTVLAKKQVIV